MATHQSWSAGRKENNSIVAEDRGTSDISLCRTGSTYAVSEPPKLETSLQDLPPPEEVMDVADRLALDQIADLYSGAIKGLIFIIYCMFSLGNQVLHKLYAWQPEGS